MMQYSFRLAAAVCAIRWRVRMLVDLLFLRKILLRVDQIECPITDR